ncbi:hypothetical protein BJ138DRAFT_1147664 [Hygrophoropsis aurantiaca]|uniref:Uncharacterized protein n=1 Tax=Hygrophoropsis aurantiaca TaxID=72124 RepID=A0ACB8AH95_9AGAM|nr:hypothetical protein BJ138DRAFT_1147664 [Hygrophoropsis aurantiaca]
MSKPQCQNEACALQTCLSANTYSPEKCDRYLRELYTCCSEMYKSSSSQDAERKMEVEGSSACPMPSVVDRWLKTHPPEQSPKSSSK